MEPQHNRIIGRVFLSDRVQLIYAPESTQYTEITPLGYIYSFDYVSRKDYAFIHYKEIDKRTGKCLLRIKSYGELGARIELDSEWLKNQFSEAAKNGLDHIIIGHQIKPDDLDPRRVEHRLYFDKNLNATILESHLVMRNEDHSPSEEQVLRNDLSK